LNDWRPKVKDGEKKNSLLENMRGEGEERKDYDTP